jgi:hypothetical protein
MERETGFRGLRGNSREQPQSLPDTESYMIVPGGRSSLKPDSNPYRTDSMEFPHGIRIPWNFYGIRIFMDSMDFFPNS